MIFRHNGFGLSLAASLASAFLTFSVPALAQDPAATDAPPVDAPIGAPTDTPAAVTPDAPPEAAPSGDVTTSPAAPAVEEASAEAVPAEEQKAIPEPSPATEAVALAVVQLPGSAYPSIQTRGISYGSLWRTFHGQQWPYMPQVGAQTGFQLGLSGGIWSDLSNTQLRPDDAIKVQGYQDLNRWNSQARGVLRVTPTFNAGDGWFVQGNAELVVQGDMSPPASGVIGTTDDLWVRVGKWNLFDVTIGRFQGWEIANHYGMALDQNTLERFGALLVGGGGGIATPTDGYGLTYFWDRQDFLLGAYAVHVYPTKYLRAEILGHIGAGGVGGSAQNPNQVDVRPSVIFDVGFLKVKAGWEYGSITSQDKTLVGRESKNGFGVAAQAVFAPYVEFGGSFARGYRDVFDRDDQVDLAKSNTVQTVGGFLNASPGHEPLVIGIGAFLNHDENLRVDKKAGAHFNEVDTNDQWLIFAAVQYTLWSQFYVKLVVSNASNQGETSTAATYVNNALSGRLRVEFLF
jgi:hypothetical protein